MSRLDRVPTRTPALLRTYRHIGPHVDPHILDGKPRPHFAEYQVTKTSLNSGNGWEWRRLASVANAALSSP